MPRASDPTAAVLHAVLAHEQPRPTYRDLASSAAVSERSVSNAIRTLAEDRLLIPGRPARLGPGLGLAIGVALGQDTVCAGLVDANGALMHVVRGPPLAGQLDLSPRQLLGRVRATLRQVLARGLSDETCWSRGSPTLQLLGVAIAWPALDQSGRAWARALRHPDWYAPDDHGPTLPLQVRGAEVFGSPFAGLRFVAHNYVNAQALALAFDDARDSRARGHRSRMAIVVRVGEDVTAAISQTPAQEPGRLSFLDARLVLGRRGISGQVGHVPVEQSWIDACNRDNPFPDLLEPLSYKQVRCSCGARNHVEAFVSASAIVRRLSTGRRVRDSSEPHRADATAPGSIAQLHAQAVQDAGRLLGRSLVGSILMLAPDSVILTGSLASEHLRNGLLREQHQWSTALGDAPAVRGIAGSGIHHADASAILALRGAALGLIRARIYRRVGHVLRHGSGTLEFGPAELDQLWTGIRSSATVRRSL